MCYRRSRRKDFSNTSHCAKLPTLPIKSSIKDIKPKKSLLAFTDFASIEVRWIIYMHLKKLNSETIYYFFEWKGIENAGTLYECHFSTFLNALLKWIAKKYGFTLLDLKMHYFNEALKLTQNECWVNTSFLKEEATMIWRYFFEENF